MEAKLREYRAIRRRKELIENAKEKLQLSKEKIYNFMVPEIFKNMEKEKNEDEILLLENEEEPKRDIAKLILNQTIEEPVDAASETSEVESSVQESWHYFAIKWSLYSIIWISLYIFFLKIQFGAVFFVLSILIGICLNTRIRPKKAGEISAYSVFNENCVSIDGTLNAEQFENEIRYGAGTTARPY